MKKLTWHAGIFPPYQGQDDLHRVWEADELPGGLHLQIWQEQIVHTYYNRTASLQHKKKYKFIRKETIVGAHLLWLIRPRKLALKLGLDDGGSWS